MDLSSLFRGSACPSERFLASSHGSTIVVRDAGALEVVASYKCQGASHLSHLAFSPDGLSVVACDESKGVVWVFAVEGSEIARIQAGVEGCKGVRWISDDAIAVWSEHGLRLTLYSLNDARSTAIHYPKLGPQAGWQLRPQDARFFALLERDSGKDAIGLYDRFALATTDAADFAWSPCGRFLAVWESPIELSVLVYTVDGRNVATLSPPPEQDVGLGVRSVTWHPSSRYLCVGGWDGRIRVYNDLTFALVADVQMTSRVGGSDTLVFREPSDWLARTRGKGIIAFDTVAAPTALPSVRPESSKPPAIGISSLSFSSSGSLLAATLAATPRCVHLYSFDDDAGDGALVVRLHAVAILANPLNAVDWARGPQARDVLAVAYGSQSVGVYGLQEESALPAFEGVGVPASGGFAVKKAQWMPDGRALVLSNAEAFCLAVIVE